MKKFWMVMMLGLSSFVGFQAHAEVEIEVDPIAYALKGYSFHAIYSGKSSRVDVGVFALELPEDSKNPDYTVSFEGSGVKWDYFGASVDGGFWGVQASSTSWKFEYDNSEDALSAEETDRTVNNYGIRIGYRFGTDGWYITPWVSMDYNQLRGGDVILGNQKYDFQKITFFPTVHVGYRF